MTVISDKKIFYTIFIVINLFLSSYFIYVWDDWNSISRILPILSVYENNTLSIDKYHEHTGDKSYVSNHYYSDKAPLPSFLVMPFYFFLNKVGIIKTSPEVYNEKPAYFLGSFLCAALPFTLILLFCFLYLPFNRNSFSPVILIMLSFYGSFIFVYSGTFYAHIISAFFLLVAYIYLKFHEKYFLSGFFIGLGFLSEYTVAIALPVWAFILLINYKNLKPSIYLCIGFLPSLIFILAYNYSLSGSPFTLLYHFVVCENSTALKDSLGFQFPHFFALWDLLFSQYRGVFFYFPILILSAWQFIKLKVISFIEISRNYWFLLTIFYFLLISSHVVWHGGWVYGPRHLIPIAVLLGFEGVRFLSKNNFPKWMFWVLTSIGLLITWMTKSTVVFDIVSDLIYPVTDFVIPEFLNKHYNANNIFTTFFNLKPDMAVYLWLLLFIASSLLLSRWYKKISL